MIEPALPSLLVVDDDPGQATLLATVARDHGFTATIAGDRDAMLAALRASEPDLLVLDLELPGADGIQILRELHQRQHRGPLVLVSGHAPRTLRAAETIAREFGLQVLAALHKPFPLGSFLALLDRLTPNQHHFRFPESSSIDAADVRDAITAGRMQPWLQPQFNLADGTLHGFEMLARWRRGDGALVSPTRFIPVAERNGLIGELTFSLLAGLFAELRSAPTASAPWRLSVNLSPESLHDLELPERLSACFAVANVDPRRITFEVTETRLMRNLASSLDVLTRLSLRGFRIAIDDFGTGYSTLSHLARLPCSELKIDRSFVAALFVDGNAEVIVRKTVEMGQELGLQVTAEGVETRQQYLYLEDLGCDVVQGNLAGAAAPVREAIRRHQQRPETHRCHH